MMTGAPGGVDGSVPSLSPRRPSGSFSLGLTIGVAIGIVATLLFLALVVVHAEENPTTVGGGGVFGSSEFANLSGSYDLTGISADTVNVSFCPPAESSYGSDWVCAFTVRTALSAPACSSVDRVGLIGANESSLYPTVPQTICPGASVTFALSIYVPDTSPATVAFYVEIDIA